MVNYSNGKIYKIEPIVEHDEGDIYIGSTTKQYLSQRMDSHRNSYKQWKKGNKGLTTSFLLFEKYGIQNCCIILLESVNANSKDELHAREKHYIQMGKCVNKIVPSRKNQEYRDNHKEHKACYDKQYRQLNHEKLNEKCNCPCGGSYSIRKNKLSHERTIKHQNYLKSLNDIETPKDN